MDDTVVKSKRAEDHIKNLDEVFGVLKKYKVKLNLEKCIFGVSTEKFLGFMVF